MAKKINTRLELPEGIQIGNVTSGPTAGMLRWTGVQFEGHDGSNWSEFGGGDIGFETIVNFNTTDVANDLYSSDVQITGITFSTSSSITDWQVATASGFSTPTLPFNVGQLEEVQWKIIGATQGVLLVKGTEI